MIASRVARFLLDGPVLPLVTDTVRVAEAFRAAAMARFRRWAVRHPDLAEPFRRPDRPDRPDAFASPVLAGKDPTGRMRTDHGHAFYLPTADGPDPRRLSHLTVLAADGLGTGEVAALAALRQLTGATAAGPLRVQLVGLGRPADFTHRLFRPARVWTAVTPFVGPAHIGRRGRDRYLRKAVRATVRRLVAGGQLAAEPTAIELRPTDRLGLAAVQYRRQRSRAGERGGSRAATFVRLTFDRPVSGPVCLGYGSHFGLGLFVPDDDPAEGE